MLATFFQKLTFLYRFATATRGRRLVFCLSLGLAVGGLFLLLPFSTARAATPSIGVTDIINQEKWGELLAWFLLIIARFFLSITLFLLSFVIEIAAYNSYLSASSVSVGWVMVRDITNMFFVVVLLIIAFGTILGLEQYEWKKMLVKFVLAAILVNFSRLICGVLIDISQVIMTTFVNGIAATAGGNLIHMFSLDNILALSSEKTPGDGSYFVAGVAAVTFSATIMVTMGVFVYMLLGRMLTLWILIILSPFAFVLSLLPQTQSYASKWWKEFGANLVTGPALLFFIWLSFVTLGNGKINDQIANGTSLEKSDGAKLASESPNTSGILKAMTWSNMANFAIGIGMLFAGIKVAQELGGAGAGALSHATDFGKKVAMMASGITAARWTGQNVVKPVAKYAAMNFPIVGGQKWVNRGKKIKSVARLGLARFSGIRDEKAKKLEADSKKLNEMKSDVKAGRMTQEEFDAEYKEKYNGKLRLSDLRKELGDGKITQQDFDSQSKDYESRYEGKAGRRFLGRLAAGFVESGGRSDKTAEDWEKWAENEEKGVEEDYSTSSKFAGRQKLSSGVMLHKLEEQNALKKERKEGEKDEELLNTNKKYQDTEKNIQKETIQIEKLKDAHSEHRKLEVARLKEKFGEEKDLRNRDARLYQKRKDEVNEMSVESKQIEDKLTAKKELALLGAIKNLLSKDKKDATGKEDKAGYNRAVEIGRLKAQTEPKTRDREQEEAEFKAEGYKEEGDDLRAEGVRRDAAAKAYKAENEPLSSLSFAEKSILASNLNKNGRIGQIKPGEKAQSTRSAVSLLAATANDDAETFDNTFQTLLVQAGWTGGDVTDDNRYRAQLSALLGRDIQFVGAKTDEDKENILKNATEEVEKAYGDDPDKKQYNEAMRHLGAGYKKLAKQGVVAFTGMVGEGSDEKGRAVFGLGVNVSKFDIKGKMNVEKDAAGVVIPPKKDAAGEDIPPKRKFAQDTSLDNYEYWTTRMDLRTVQHARDLGSKDTAGNLTGFSDVQAKAFGKAFDGKDARQISSSFTSSFYSSLNKAKVDLSTVDKKYANMYEEVAKNCKDLEAFSIFVAGSKDLWAEVAKKTGKTIDQFYKQFHPVAPAAAAGGGTSTTP